jgi:tetratricopeptide (TPR) repeat protein
VLGGVVVIGALAGVMIYGVFSEQLQMRLRGTSFSEGDPRPFIWRAALAQYAEQPLVGEGARMFYDGCITHRVADSPPWMVDAEFAHNEWLQMLADYGWVGLVLMVIMLFMHFANAAAYLRWFVNDKFPRTASLTSGGLALVLGAAAALAALLAHATFEFNFHVPAIAVTAACLLGICANPGCTPEAKRAVRVPGARLLLKLGLIGASAGILWGAMKFGRADYCAERANLAHDEEDATIEKLKWLSEAIALDPHNSRLWEARGRTRITAANGMPVDLERSLLKRAVTDLDEALRLNPRSYTATLELADALMPLGDFERASKTIQDSLALAPLFERPRLTLAHYYNRLQRWQDAEEAYLYAADARAGKSGDWFAEYSQMLKDASEAAK